MEKGPSIFSPGSLPWLRHWIRPKHDARALEAALDEVFGERLLGQSTTRLVIPAFDAQRGDIQLFKTAHSAAYKQDRHLRAATVAVSSAAAPTYFSAHTTPSGGCYLDGGVWANCPALVGILEALCILGVPRERLRVLSIGTTSEPYFVKRSQRDGGKASWGKDAVPLLMQAQLMATLGECRLLLGDRFKRIDRAVPPGLFAMDNPRTLGDLRALGEQAARSNETMVATEFLYAPAAEFVPSGDAKR